MRFLTLGFENQNTRHLQCRLPAFVGDVVDNIDVEAVFDVETGWHKEAHGAFNVIGLKWTQYVEDFLRMIGNTQSMIVEVLSLCVLRLRTASLVSARGTE